MKGWKKKVIGLFWLLMSSFLLFGCGTEKEQDKVTLYQKGLEVIERMDLIAECKDYISLTSYDELVNLIDKIAEKDYTKPDAVYQITITEDAIKKTLSLAAEKDLEISEEILPSVYQRFISAVPTALNAVEGSSALAVTSILTADTAFLYQDLEEYTIYLYLYQDAYSAAVVFFPMEEGIVRGTGSFIVNDQLLWNLAEQEIVELLESTGYFSGCKIQQIEVQ